MTSIAATVWERNISCSFVSNLGQGSAAHPSEGPKSCKCSTLVLDLCPCFSARFFSTLQRSKPNRHKGSGHTPIPASPPYVRVRGLSYVRTDCCGWRGRSELPTPRCSTEAQTSVVLEIWDTRSACDRTNAPWCLGLPQPQTDLRGIIEPRDRVRLTGPIS